MKFRDLGWPVSVAGFSGAQQAGCPARGRIDPLYLVVVGIRDVEDSIVQVDAQRMLQPHLISSAVHISKGEQVLPNNGCDGPGGFKVG